MTAGVVSQGPRPDSGEAGALTYRKEVGRPFSRRRSALRWCIDRNTAMDEIKRQYVGALEAWQKQLQDLHRVLLQGEKMDPPKLKGLLNREALAKERYDQARRRLLGLSGDE